MSYPGGVVGAVSWDVEIRHQTYHGVTNVLGSGTLLERRAIGGNSPVHEIHAHSATDPK
jgi:hypothetical protein